MTEALKNNTQLGELKLTPEQAWNKRVGRVNNSNPRGIETPLGHAYSLILEALAEEGRDSTPNPQEFLEYIRGKMENTSYWYEAKHLSLLSRSHENPECLIIANYAGIKNLSKERTARIMEEILGYKKDWFNPAHKTSFLGSEYFRKRD